MVHALETIHSALVPGGLLVDTQPVSAAPPVEAAGRRLGLLAMSNWARTIEAVDARTSEALEAGLFAIEQEARFVVADRADSGSEFVEKVRGWKGTRISAALAARAEAAPPPVSVHQEVRLRVMRAL